MYHEYRLPMLYLDQLSTISHYLSQLKNTNSQYSTATINRTNSSPSGSNQYLLKMLQTVQTYGTLNTAKVILPKNKYSSSTKLTYRKYKRLYTWSHWQKNEYKQLNQYHDQNMFGEPCKLPYGANVRNL